MNNHLIIKCLLAILLALPLSTVAQETDINIRNNSPYSRFGLGDLLNQHFVGLIGMGDQSAAFHSPLQANPLNPASLAHMETASFEVGLYAKYAGLKDDSQSADYWSGNLSYLSLSFPVFNPLNKVFDQKERPFAWGMNLTLAPLSTVEYGVEIQDEIFNYGRVINYFSGSGGTYRFKWGNGFRKKNLSAGFTMGVLFGNLSLERQVYLPEALASYDISTNRDLSLSGFTWDAGLQYDFHIMQANEEGEQEKSGKLVTVGLYGNSANGFTTKSSLLEVRTNRLYPDLDTISNLVDITGDGTMPASLSVGIMYQEINRLRLGLQYSLTTWSQFENEAKPESLDDSWMLSAGGEYVPDHQSFRNYFQKVHYRFGLFYGTDPRGGTGLDLKTYGVTFGAGFPIILPRQVASFVNFSTEVGRFGDADGLREFFVRMSLGFSLNDNSWFFKRRFN